jgi:hypothetical protein
MIGFAEAGVSFEKQNLVRAIFQSMCKHMFNYIHHPPTRGDLGVDVLTV